MTLLLPSSNDGIDITVSRRYKARNEYGEVEEISDSETAEAIVVELGRRKHRTDGGLRLTNMIEVHLTPDFSDLEAGEAFFIIGGKRFRVLEKFDMHYFGRINMIMFQAGEEPDL